MRRIFLLLTISLLLFSCKKILIDDTTDEFMKILLKEYSVKGDILESKHQYDILSDEFKDFEKKLLEVFEIKFNENETNKIDKMDELIKKIVESVKNYEDFYNTVEINYSIITNESLKHNLIRLIKLKYKDNEELTKEIDGFKEDLKKAFTPSSSLRKNSIETEKYQNCKKNGIFDYDCLSKLIDELEKSYKKLIDKICGNNNNHHQMVGLLEDIITEFSKEGLLE